MGNWMSVEIIGTCQAAEVAALKAAIAIDEQTYARFHCLSNTSGIGGLGNWAAEQISRIGNLAERDYTTDDVARTLEQIATTVPSLTVKVHCGGDYESKTCVATVTLAEGKAVVGPPEIEKVRELSQGEMEERVMAALFLSARRF